MGYRRWTEQELAQLAAMRRAGVSYEECGARLGRSRLAINDMVIRRGLTRSLRYWSQEEIETFETLRIGGATYPQIAAVMNRSFFAVKGYGDRNFMRRGNPHYERLVPHLNKTVAEQAKALGITTSRMYTVRRELKRAGFDLPKPPGRWAGHILLHPALAERRRRKKGKKCQRSSSSCNRTTGRTSKKR